MKFIKRYLENSVLVCDYLGTSMIDVSPLADKEKKVVLDIRKKLRPYASESFFSQEGNQYVTIDTNARYLRTGKISKLKGGKK